VRNLHELTRVELLEAELDHRHAAAARGDAAGDEAIETIAEVIGNGDQTQGGWNLGGWNRKAQV
jgi:hypothetical protein